VADQTTGGPRKLGASAGPLGERAATNPADVFAVRGARSPLIGREGELSRMREVVGNAVDFQAPQLVTIIGNQGTGKSRLVSELMLRGAPDDMRVYSGAAVADGPRYGVISAYLRNRFNIREGEPPEKVLAEFRREVGRVFRDENIAEVLHFLGGFLDLHFPDSPFLRVLKDGPQQHEEIARTVLRRFIEVDASHSPVLLVFDDLQWADDPTLDLLKDLTATIGGSPVVIAVCARPDFIVRCPDWGEGVEDQVRIELRNLEPDDAERMFRNLLERCDNLPFDIIDDAVEMTGGNPYFLEELVRLLLANGTIDTSGPRWRLDAARAAETELPISIEEAIEARIAALEFPERDVLEKGAIFGNVFWEGSIVSLARLAARTKERELEGQGGPPPQPRGDMSYAWTSVAEPHRREVERILQDLVERDYLLRLEPEDSTVPGDVEYVFKHNLERDLIARSTDARKLASYLRFAAQWLEAKLSARSEEQLEFLAQLYERGGDRQRAAKCYLAGGDKARQRYANDTAVELYDRGLAMIDEDDAVARIDALHNLGDVLDLVGRGDEALDKFSEMLRTAWLYDHRAKAGAAHGRLGRIYRGRGEYDVAMEHLREAHELFSAARDDRGVAGTLDDIGKVHFLRGAYTQALTFYRQALSIRRAVGDRRSIALSLANIGRVHHDSGAFKAAVEQFREALDLRRDAGDRPGVVRSLCDLGRVHTDDGNVEMALDLFAEANKIAVEIGDKMSEAQVLSHIGKCKAELGHGGEAVANLEMAIDLATQLGDRVTLADCVVRLADVYLSVDDAPRAYDEARRALALSEAVSSRVHVGMARRALAESIALGGFSDQERRQAEESFRQAIEVLAGMKNEVELARCYRAFADFRERCGDAADASKLRRRAEEIFNRLRGAAAFD